MPNDRIDNLVIEDAKVIFRNFSGAETKYNRAGNRTFCVIIDDEETAHILANTGWNIKSWSRSEDEPPTYYLQVKVRYDNMPPHVYLISGRTKTELDEETVGLLDNTDLKTCDLIIHPYRYEVHGKTGISAYLKKGYFVLDLDELDAKYASEEAPIEDTPF